MNRIFFAVVVVSSILVGCGPHGQGQFEIPFPVTLPDGGTTVLRQSPVHVEMLPDGGSEIVLNDESNFSKEELEKQLGQ